MGLGILSWILYQSIMESSNSADTTKKVHSGKPSRHHRPEYALFRPSGVSYHCLTFLSPSCPIANTDACPSAP